MEGKAAARKDRDAMKSRFLSESEKKDVTRAVIDIVKRQHPDCIIQVTVADETDDRGVPQYQYTLKPIEPKRPS